MTTLTAIDIRWKLANELHSPAEREALERELRAKTPSNGHSATAKPNVSAGRGVLPATINTNGKSLEPVGEPTLKCTPASDVVVRRTEWLMPGRIPRNELAILDGDGGIGKTTVALHIIACSTSGKQLPDGSLLEESPIVLILAEEDSLSMLKARLVVAGADLSCITFVSYVQLGNLEGPFLLPTHVPLLQKLAEETKATLFYIDSLFSHFHPELNAHRAQDVRFALRPLVELAHNQGVTIWGTRHWTKASGSASSRGLGSSDIRNISRSVISFAKHPTLFEEKGLYVMAVSKSNYGPPTEALLYKIEAEITNDDSGNPFEIGRISWEGKDATTADDIACEADPPEERSARAEAREVILEFLGTGEKSADQLDKHLSAAHISTTTWHRARRDLRKEKRIERSGGGTAGPVRWAQIVTSATDSHISTSDEECNELAKSGESGTPRPSTLDDLASQAGLELGDSEAHEAGVGEDSIPRLEVP